MRFYSEAFGFEVGYRWPPGEELEYAFLRLVLLLDLRVPQLVAPSDQPWGERLAYFEDPDGNPIQITTPVP